MLRQTPVVDFHTHILPHADHGCDGIETFKAQISMLKKSGTDTMVATPHFYPHVHRVDDFLARIDATVESILPEIPADSPQIKLGAEVLICDGLEKMEELDRLCIRGTKLLLLELPQDKISSGHIETVEMLTDNGYTVVLAHIDRYIGNFKSEIDTLLSVGAYAQVNAVVIRHPLLLGSIKKYLSETDRICAFGSDLHGCNKHGYTCFNRLNSVFKERYREVMNRSLELLEGSRSICP